jgi:arylsulfatase A-like enzyme
MKQTDRILGPLAAKVVAVAGAAILGFALTSDWLLGGSPGIGRQQLILAAAGAFLLLAGLNPGAEDRRQLWSALTARPDEALLGFGDVVKLAVVFSFGTALAETAVLATLRLGFGQMVRTGPHVVWMSSLANLAVLGVLGAVLWAVGTKWKKLKTPAVVVFVFALLAVDAIIHRLPVAARADSWAKWLLVGGAAVALSRAMRSGYSADRPPRYGKTAAALASVVVLLSASVFAYPGLRERLIRSGLPPAAQSPNVLLIILDTVRAANLSLYGYERRTTPNLERFAERGVVFDRAIAPSPWTLPSHAVLFSGRDPNELNADWWLPLDERHPMLAEVLSARGYATAGFSANISYASAEAGLARGFHRFDDFAVKPGEILRTSTMLRRALRAVGARSVVASENHGRKVASDVSGAFLSWLDDKPDDRRYFAFLNYFDSHDPYYAEAPFDTLFGPVRPMTLNWGSVPDTAQISAWTDGYDRSLAFLDDALGRLFDELQRRGTLDETVVIVTSDHGELLGEQGFMRHGTTLYMPVLHVPLIVRFPPAVPAGVRVDAPVTLRDIPATVLDLIGASDNEFAGKSLASRWLEPGSAAAPVYSEVREALRIPKRYPNAESDLYSLLDEQHHYIRSSDNTEELYLYSEDPLESRNMAVEGVAEAVLAGLRADLRRQLGGELRTAGGDTLR